MSCVPEVEPDNVSLRQTASEGTTVKATETSPISDWLCEGLLSTHALATNASMAANTLHLKVLFIPNIPHSLKFGFDAGGKTGRAGKILHDNTP
jgi:hypothetical protein